MFDPKYMIEITQGKVNPTDLQALDDLFDAAAQQPGPVVFHFHGGLVSKDAATGAAVADSTFYRQAGAFPIFPIWKTGPKEVLPEVLGEIAREGLFKLLLDRVVGLAHAQVANALGNRGANVDRTLPPVEEAELRKSSESERGDFSPDFLDPEDFAKIRNHPEYEMTEMEEASIESQIETDVELLAEIDAVLNGAAMPIDDDTRSASALPTKSEPKTSHADPEFLKEFQQEANERGLGIKAGWAVLKIIGRVIRRFIQGKDHGVHATAVEEILREVYGSFVGTIGWSVMKAYTETAAAPGGASMDLLDRIATKLQGKRVVLVGHSAGAIFVSNLMNAAGQAGLDLKFEVIFLAPAVRMSTFKKGIVDREDLLASYGPNSLCFRTYTMSDALETKDTLIRNVPHLGDLTWFYPRSLLYLISGILEGKEDDADLVGLERFHKIDVWNADEDHIKSCREFLLRPGHVSYSVNNGSDPKMHTNSNQHGGFGAFMADAAGVPTNSTMVSIASILKTGW
jgi:hypothetical protein